MGNSDLGMFRKLLRCAGVVLAFMLLGPVGSSQSTNGDRDVAFWREPGVQVEVSSFLFRSKKAEEQIPCPVNRGADAADALGPCHWQSNQFQHLPQWVWVHFAGQRRMDKVVVHAASMDSRPVEISGEYLGPNAAFHRIFHVEQAQFDPQTLTYTVPFAPVEADNFRLVVERTAAAATPQVWTAELAQLQVYGTDATARPMEEPVGGAGVLPAELAATDFTPKVEELGGTLAISTPWYRLELDKAHPRIVSLALDSLGKGELGVNLLQASGAYPVLDGPFEIGRASCRERV